MKVHSRSNGATAAWEAAGQDELRYAIVHDWLPVMGGAELVLQEICELFPGPVYTSQCRHDLFPWLQEREVHTSYVQHLPWALSKHYIYAPLMPAIYSGMDLSDADVVIVGSHSFGHHAKGRPDAVTVCYYHTTARSLWHPEIDNRASSGHLAWARKMLAPKLKTLDLEASHNPDYIIANSLTTADRIRNDYGREVDQVIYPPVFTEKWKDVERKRTDGSLLIWGRLVPYKRIDLAIEAVRLTGDHLHVVGAGNMEANLRNRAEGMPNVEFHGRLPEADLKQLMSRCRAVLFPGYEDFGIVPVEAMAAGIPVIAFAAGGASESVGKNGTLFDRQDAFAVAEAIGHLKQREFSVAELRARAAQFDVTVFRRRFNTAVALAVNQKRQKLQRSLAA